jgi:chromosome segregation ATPase
MEISDLSKRLDSLEKENRLQKDVNEQLKKQIDGLQNDSKVRERENKDLNSEVTQLKILVSKVDDYGKMLSDYKTEINKEMDAQDKRISRTEKDLQQKRDLEIERLNKNYELLRNEINSISNLEKKIPGISEQIDRLGKNLNDAYLKIDQVSKVEENYQRVLSENSLFRQGNDKKHNEVAVRLDGLQFHVDELRGKSQLMTDNIKKSELRLNEISASEVERRENQDRFMEKINLTMLEHEKSIVELDSILKEIEIIKDTFADQVREVEVSARMTESSRNQYRDLIDKLDRRINEITEIQRIGEDRFRQEWSSFKAEDQKRWSNYLLSQDERQNERSRKVDKLVEKQDSIEDSLVILRDKVSVMSELSEKRLNSLLSLSREWMADNVRAND